MVVSQEQNIIERQLEEHWFIAGLVLTSMLCQILLLLTGGTRKWMQLLQATAWLAYTGADAVASCCLGAMSRLSQVLSLHSVWAAMLLMHLGGVDNISAYSPEDAELWGRHGLLMAQQVLTAFYILGRTARGPFAGVSIVLMLVGSLKYMEKTWALRCASAASLTRQVRLMSNYRSADREKLTANTIPLEEINTPNHNSTACNSIPQNIKNCPIPSSSISSSSRTPTAAAASSPNMDVSQDQMQTQSSRVEQNDQWRQFNYRLDVSDKVSLTDGRRMKVNNVTLGQVLCCEELSKMPHLMTLCKAFALFKLYRRRILRLSMPESGGERMRLFLRKLVEENSLGDVLEVELRFLFDGIYTKAAGTAFTAWGFVLRTASVCLLFVSAISVFRVLHFDTQEDGPGFKAVTAWLFLGGLLIDVYQLCRWMMSDWTRVRLACSYVEIRASLAAEVVDRQNLSTSVNQTTVGRRLRRCRLACHEFIHGMRRCCAWFTLTLLHLLESGPFVRSSYWVKDIGRSCVFTAGAMEGVPASSDSIFGSLAVLKIRVRLVLRRLEELWGGWAREAKVFVRMVICDRLRAAAAANDCCSCKTAPNTSTGLQDVDIMRKYLVNDVFKLCEERLGRPGGNSRVSMLRSDLGGVSSQLMGMATACLPLLQEMRLDKLLGWSVLSDWEHSVLIWHVATFLYSKASIIPTATAACASGADDNVSEATDRQQRIIMMRRCALRMSEYMAYLLQKRTELLPCHPYVGREMVWTGTVEASQSAFDVAAGSVDEVRQWINGKMVSLESTGYLNTEHLRNYPLDGGVVLACQLLNVQEGGASQDDEEAANRQPPPTWIILYNVWREILLVTAAANSRPMAHVEQLASGAELLTLFWVLLGHTLGS